MGASEQDEDKEYIIDALFAETQTEIHRMCEHPDDYDEETQSMLDGLAFACAQYNTFLKGAGETKKSIIITTGVHLAPLQVREVRRILDGDDIRLETLDQGKRIIYLELPDTNATFSFIASVFYQCLFETLVRKADAKPDGVLDRDVHCMLDEFANIGKIPNFVRLIATIRSRRISCSIILQTVSQGKSLYRDDWETIAGNCDSQLFLGGNEPSTTKPSTSSKPAKPKASTAAGHAAPARTPENSSPRTNSDASPPASASTYSEAYRHSNQKKYANNT